MTQTKRTRTVTKPIKPRRTQVQKTREIVLTLLDVDKADIERATGVSKGILFNIFTDRHRSIDAETAVITYLDSKIDESGPWEREMLRKLGFKGTKNAEPVITHDHFGWPAPE